MKRRPVLTPSPRSPTKQGKPLLSWRVAILPYIEQQTLYQKFKLDEPWDSAHNKALLKEMPLAYACPSRADSESFATPYQVFTGNGTMFEDGRGMKRAEITDGWPNTILVAEAEVTVPWTKPDDLRFDPAAARPSQRPAPLIRAGLTWSWPTTRCTSSRARLTGTRSGP